MERDRLAALAATARRQQGVFSVTQARDLGVDRRRLGREAVGGSIERIHPSVYRFVAAHPSTLQATWAAVLQAGAAAAASHESALHAHRVERVPFVVAVSVPPGSRADHAGIRVHRVGDLHPSHRELRGGLVVTTLERAVVDVASVFSPRRLAWLIDHLTIVERRTSTGAIGRVLRQVNRRGRRGVRVLDEVLDARSPGQAAPRSRVERRIDELLAATDLPTPLREHPLPGAEPGAGLVDRAWPDVALILEVDGRTWHAREQSMATDRARDRAAARAGWVTIRVLDDEVRDIPDVVVADIVATHRRRRRMHPLDVVPNL